MWTGPNKSLIILDISQFTNINSKLSIPNIEIKITEENLEIIQNFFNKINKNTFNGYIGDNIFDKLKETIEILPKDSYDVFYKNNKIKHLCWNVDKSEEDNITEKNNLVTKPKILDKSEKDNITEKNKLVTNSNSNTNKINILETYSIGFSFVFVITSYNNSKWINKNLSSILIQNYNNWRIIYIDDHSNDNTLDLVKEFVQKNKIQNKITIIENEKNYKQAYSRYIAFKQCKDEEICCLLDGDDWLYDKNVLTNLNLFYAENDVDISFGTFQYYHNGKLGKFYPINNYDLETKKQNSYGYNPWWFPVHMRCGKAKYYKSYPLEYIKNIYKNSEYLDRCTDLNEMIWVLNKSNGKNKNHNFTTYVYNKDASLENSNSYYNSLYSDINFEITNHIRLNSIYRYKKQRNLLILTKLSFKDEIIINFCKKFNKIFKLFFKKDFNNVDQLEVYPNFEHVIFIEYPLDNNLKKNIIKNKFEYSNYKEFNQKYKIKAKLFNCVYWHAEILESCILYLKHNKDVDLIYLDIPNRESMEVKDYLANKYDFLVIENSSITDPRQFDQEKDVFIDHKNMYDYVMSVSYHGKSNIDNLDPDKYIFLYHRNSAIYKENILMPFIKSNNYLDCSILPFQNNKKIVTFPTFIVQGNLDCKRKNYYLLTEILKKNYKYNYFKIIIIGRGKDLPEVLKPYENKISLFKYLDFVSFHKKFLECQYIFSLVSKKNQPQYYSEQISSTYNYAKSYNLNIILDEDLNKIYNLKNSTTYKNDDDFLPIFSNILKSHKITINLIYLNLDKCKERNKNFLNMINNINEKLKEYSIYINAIRFNAIDGSIKDEVFKYVDSTYELSEKEISTTIGHLLSIKYAFENNFDICFILEDDNVLNIYDLYISFIDALNNMPNDLECWQLTVTNPFEFYEKEDNYFCPRNNRLFNAGGYLIKNIGMEKILQKYLKSNNKFDLSSFNDRKLSDIVIFDSIKTYVSNIPFILSPPIESIIHTSHMAVHNESYKKQMNKFEKVLKKIGLE